MEVARVLAGRQEIGYVVGRNFVAGLEDEYSCIDYQALI